ncbi:MAG TPA: type IV secretion protein Rhs, partial [Runella sp.]|nr:type IV secretion protein Rhs [Runella sp.]
MKTHYLLLFFVLGSIVMGWSQPMANRVTGVTVPSPDAASLGKFGDIPVGHFTGSVSTSVPIHTLKAGPLSLDISLQYHSSGLRVAEPASWVGMGWALQTGGIISRTVQGTEDELSGGYLSQGSLLTLNNNCVVHPNYSAPITSMANAQLDGEPDIFSFSVGGYNGKFYINASGTVVQIPKSDLKIEYTLNGSVSNVYRLKKFVITTPDGVKYMFGDIDDGNNAIDISTVNNSLFQTANNWKLKKIESADAAYHFLFTYEEEKFTYAMRARNGLYTS